MTKTKQIIMCMIFLIPLITSMYPGETIMVHEDSKGNLTNWYVSGNTSSLEGIVVFQNGSKFYLTLPTDFQPTNFALNLELNGTWITQDVVTTTSSGGGSSNEPIKYTPSQNSLNSGYTISLREKDYVKFTYKNNYEITYLDKEGDTAKIDIQEKPGELVFSIGQGMKFDADDDGYYDLMVGLKELSTTKAKIIIQIINESVVTNTPLEEGVNTNIVLDKVVNESDIQIDPIFKTKDNISFEGVPRMMFIAFVIIAPFFISVGLVFWLLVKWKERKFNKEYGINENE